MHRRPRHHHRAICHHHIIITLQIIIVNVKIPTLSPDMVVVEVVHKERAFVAAEVVLPT